MVSGSKIEIRVKGRGQGRGQRSGSKVGVKIKARSIPAVYSNRQGELS